MSKLTTKTEKALTQKTVKAPQSIVHIKHIVTIRQYKLWVIFLQHYRQAFERGEKGDKHGFIAMPISEVTNALGYEYQKAELRADLEALGKARMTLSYLEKGGEKVDHYLGFVSEIKQTSKTLAFVLPSIARDAMEGLDQPGAMFQLINWEIFNQFTGKYEAILYKLAKDYVGIGKTPYMTVEEFREYMGIRSEYPSFRELNRWAIAHPIRAINAADFSDISLTAEFEQKGRKVIGLRFLVSRKRQTKLDFPEIEPSTAFRFAKVQISLTKQTEYLALRSPEDIEASIARVNEFGEDKVKKGGKADYGALYATAIKEGWHVDYKAKTAKAEADQTAIKKRREKENEARETEQKQEDQAAKENAKLWANFLKRSESDQAAVIEQALAGNDFMLRQYRKEKREGKDLSHGMRAAVCKFLRPNK